MLSPRLKGDAPMEVLYFGSFPPPYGGVTRKNEMLFDALSERCHIERLSSEGGAFGQVRQFVCALCGSSPLVIGLGSTSKLKLLTFSLAAFAKKQMRRSVVFVMGGTLHERALEDPRFLDALGLYSAVYVESESMARSLFGCGVENVEVFPNCRVRPEVRGCVKVGDGPLKCLYYSKVCPEKGAEIALNVARGFPDVTVDFWGEFSDGDYRESFLSLVADVPNCEYKGVFQGSQEAIHQLLVDYDLMLFPSIWAHEGVAGTLVEAKSVGLPAVVFDNNFNAEVVRDGEEGLVVEAGDEEAFVRAVGALNEDRERLRLLSEGAYLSADRYFLDVYLDRICVALGLGFLEDSRGAFEDRKRG